MKRYRSDVDFSMCDPDRCGAEFVMEEDDTGPWVLFDDAAKRIAELERELAETKKRLARSFSKDWIDDCMYWQGTVLTGRLSHWCTDWDDLPVDETCEAGDGPSCRWCGYSPKGA